MPGKKGTRCVTKGYNNSLSRGGDARYVNNKQSEMQRIRNTWGLHSYSIQGLIREFSSLLLDQKNKPVRDAINREIDRLAELAKEEKNG